eukprot:3883083-Amphidinium_carterae.1
MCIKGRHAPCPKPSLPSTQLMCIKRATCALAHRIAAWTRATRLLRKLGDNSGAALRVHWQYLQHVAYCMRGHHEPNGHGDMIVLTLAHGKSSLLLAASSFTNIWDSRLGGGANDIR